MAPSYFAKKGQPLAAFSFPTTFSTYHPHLKNSSPAQPGPHFTCHHEGEVKAFLHGFAVNLIGEGRKAHVLLVILVSGRWGWIRESERQEGPQDLTQAFSPPPQTLPSLRGAGPDSASWAPDPTETISSQCTLGPTQDREKPQLNMHERVCTHAHARAHTRLSLLPPRVSLHHPLKSKGRTGGSTSQES